MLSLKSIPNRERKWEVVIGHHFHIFSLSNDLNKRTVEENEMKIILTVTLGSTVIWSTIWTRVHSSSVTALSVDVYLSSVITAHGPFFIFYFWEHSLFVFDLSLMLVVCGKTRLSNPTFNCIHLNLITNKTIAFGGINWSLWFS